MMLLNRIPFISTILISIVLGCTAQDIDKGTKTGIGKLELSENTQLTPAMPEASVIGTSDIDPTNIAPETAPEPSNSSANDSTPKVLPTLTGGFTIVSPSVPPTQNAPFMQQSTLPEGFVFIVVGAVLGFFAMSILMWRTGNAWRLHRSVQRAALNQGIADTKDLFRTTTVPTAPFYKYSDRESSVSLPGISKKSARKANKSGIPQPPRNSTANLFFSPTAGAAAASHGSGSNRGSSYFPAGFYAAGPGNGGAQGGTPAISLTNLNNLSQGYVRQRSLDLNLADAQQHYNQNVGGSERTPSLHLDNLFNRENVPSLPQPNISRKNSGLRGPNDMI